MKVIRIGVLIVAGAVLVFSSRTLAAPVSQEIGFADIAFGSLERPECEGCHGTGLADRHHQSEAATAGRCVSCHPVSAQGANVSVAVQRQCSACHNQSPHHKTEAARNRQCVSCHSGPGISIFSDSAPSYPVSSVTPTRDRCNSCHMAGDAGGHSIASPKDTHHGVVMIGCDACHVEDRANTAVRTCERCHTPAALHSVPAHVKEENCVGCHGRPLGGQ